MRNHTDNLPNSSFPERQFEGFLVVVFTGLGVFLAWEFWVIIMHILIQVEVKKKKNTTYSLQFTAFFNIKNMHIYKNNNFNDESIMSNNE